MMEHDLGCSMKIFHELCESQLCEGIGRELSGKRKDEKWRRIYNVG
jgi:hypothetical protein